MTTTRLAWIPALALLSGCAEALLNHTESAEDEEHEHEHEHHHHAHVSPAEAARVLVLESKNVDRATEVLGIVDVHEPVANGPQALEELREEAAALGAEAVLDVEFRHGDAQGPTHLSGMAVRFRRVCREPYDVVGEVRVEEPMGRHDDAVNELNRRAVAMHADCIVGIGFEHGDAEAARTVLRGTAVRYRSSAIR